MILLKYKVIHNKHMAEEKQIIHDNGLDSDTLDAFRFVLHAVKGISPVSTVAELATYDDSEQ